MSRRFSRNFLSKSLATSSAAFPFGHLMTGTVPKNEIKRLLNRNAIDGVSVGQWSQRTSNHF